MLEEKLDNIYSVILLTKRDFTYAALGVIEGVL